MTTVLVVDDDPTVTEVLSRYLEREGIDVRVAATGEEALRLADGVPPDLVVLDLMLPGITGMDVLRRLRATVAVPVVVLSARGTETDRVAGLDLGADDYVAKPFSPREVAARVRSVLRRATGDAEATDRVLDFGDLRIDLRARTVLAGGRPAPLTAREFDLLSFLARHAGEAFDRSAILGEVWGWTYGDESTVTVHVRRLRQKVEADPSTPRHLLTVWGVGYRFAA